LFVLLAKRVILGPTPKKDTQEELKIHNEYSGAVHGRRIYKKNLKIQKGL
jgi:hypothetical protein